MFKLIKWAAMGIAGIIILGIVFFGSDIFSYASSSFSSIRGKVKTAVPLEFELHRARNLLENLLPELKQNIVKIAREEVAVEELEKQIKREERRIALAKKNLRHRKKQMELHPVMRTSSEEHGEEVEELSRRFERLKLSERLLQGKKKVLAARKNSLESAIQGVKDAQVRKVELKAEIERLENQLRILKLKENAPTVNVDKSSLVKAERLVNELKKRLHVAQKVLSTDLTLEKIKKPKITKKQLLCEINEYLKEKQAERKGDVAISSRR